jgi:formylglycine-generating enzyme required for sulfatase activity
VSSASAPTPRPPAPDYPMVRVAAGAFVMGSPEGDPWHSGEELAHDVRITRPFLLGKYEITQAEWRAVTGTNPTTDVRMRWGESAWGSCATYDGFELVGDDLPAVCVSWRAAVELANAWSERAGLTPAYRIDGDTVSWDRDADGYRLPTEAEWEYAARAGSDGPFGPAGATGVCAFANLRADEHCDDGHPGLAPVGTLRPNAWGLHDMLGNAQEWVWDRYALYDPGVAVDPVGPPEGGLRVNRGGSWWRTHRTVAWRSSDADWVRAPTMGLRLARNAR